MQFLEYTINGILLIFILLNKRTSLKYETIALTKRFPHKGLYEGIYDSWVPLSMGIIAK